ncbi:hypothetical protein AB0D04_13890 [Streptomyces sp. NPDC048483]|uniref:hypothetical protein n=1 Tax=Streptomyces sp. NPDC048483 TaxID=3154927 RepID=UPI00341AB6C5
MPGPPRRRRCPEAGRQGGDGRSPVGLYGTRALILLALAPYGAWIVVISIAFGLVGFATVAPTHLMATHHFPAGYLGLVFGLLSMAHPVGSALGSYLQGILRDVTGRYPPTLLGSSAALVVAMIGCLVALTGAAGGAPKSDGGGDGAAPSTQPGSSAGGTVASPKTSPKSTSDSACSSTSGSAGPAGRP